LGGATSVRAVRVIALGFDANLDRWQRHLVGKGRVSALPDEFSISNTSVTPSSPNRHLGAIATGWFAPDRLGLFSA
jgi:hypothetical protein